MEIKIWSEERKCGFWVPERETRKVGGMNE